MTWSKLRVSIKEFITPELRKRIDIHATRYHDAHDHHGEAWITLDGKKIFGGGYYHWYVNPLPVEVSDFDVQHGFHDDFYKPQINSKKVEQIMKSGLHETSHITLNLMNYLNTPFEKIINSNNPIYKAFGIIDRRLGKRRFEKIVIEEMDHPLVKFFYELRKPTFVK